MDMAISYSLLYTLLVLILSCSLLVTKCMSKSRHGDHKKSQLLVLPPGTMGWPFIGETLQLYKQNPGIFFANKEKRYGEIFKTNILGYPCVMLTTPEAARFVLVTAAHLFKPTYPRSKEQLIGPWALFFHQGDYHQRLRKIVQGYLNLDALRNLMPRIEAAAVSILDSWDGRVTNTFDAMKKLSFHVGVSVIFGESLEECYQAQLRKNYSIVDRGYNSFPNNIPGTLYYKAVQARKRLHKMLTEIIGERRRKRSVDGKVSDMLGHLMESKDDNGTHLADDQIADNVIGVLFAAQDTTASAVTWIVKYLHDNPKILKVLKAEQMEIYLENGSGNRALTWAQTRRMSFTHQVVMESLRMASIIAFTFREAVADVEYKGFLIPKGWKAMPLFRNIHHNPEFFQHPQQFDPSRFKVAPKPNTFQPFGNGVHSCPGNEVARIEMLVFIHHLVTKYRWEIVGSDDEVEYRPFPVPNQGLPTKLCRVACTNGTVV